MRKLTVIKCDWKEGGKRTINGGSRWLSKTCLECKKEQERVFRKCSEILNKNNENNLLKEVNISIYSIKKELGINDNNKSKSLTGQISEEQAKRMLGTYGYKANSSDKRKIY